MLKGHRIQSQQNRIQEMLKYILNVGQLDGFTNAIPLVIYTFAKCSFRGSILEFQLLESYFLRLTYFSIMKIENK